MTAAIERCKARVASCEGELARLMESKGDAKFNRARRKLADDLKLARSDLDVVMRAGDAIDRGAP